MQRNELNWEKHVLPFSAYEKTQKENGILLSAWKEEINVLSQSKDNQLGQNIKTKQGIGRDDTRIRIALK